MQGANEDTPRLRLLIADDDPLSRRLLIRSLEKEYDVVECHSGFEAVQVLESGGPAVVVLDYQMPALNGAQVCEMIRSSHNPEVAQSPIIMLTGEANSEHEVKCLRSGADDFVTKPVNVAALRARIETHQRLHALHKELVAQKEELEKWRVTQEADLEAARLTQQAILPSRMPSLGAWSFSAHYHPVMQIGGDVYDWVRTSGGSLLVWMSDATGHGASAALLTTLSKVLFRHAAAEAQHPAGVMDHVEREFQAVFKGHSFMTAGCLLLSPEDGRVTFCGAGHPPLLVARHGGRVESVRSARPPLGLDYAAGSIEETLKLVHGDALLLYTDGLYEVSNPAGERLGNEGLARLLAPGAGRGATEWLKGIFEQVAEYAGPTRSPDDVTAFAAVLGK
jgi:sigma-B regulation protein RsbU (phosphoserine phosphatase)